MLALAVWRSGSLYSYCWRPITALRGFSGKRISINVYNIILPVCMHCLSRYELNHLESSGRTQIKLQNDHTRAAQWNSLLIPAPVFDVEDGATRIWKNNCYFEKPGKKFFNLDFHKAIQCRAVLF